MLNSFRDLDDRNPNDPHDVKVFGRGTMEFLSPSNGKVLAYVRRYRSDVILCVANLSRAVQPVELDLSGTPVMVFRHAGHGRVNLVYRRADGHIGWIDVPSIEQDTH